MVFGFHVQMVPRSQISIVLDSVAELAALGLGRTILIFHTKLENWIMYRVLIEFIKDAAYSLPV